MRIIFICTGNSCRSPMAELYLRHRLQCAGNERVETLSAGLCAFPGAPISLPAEKTMTAIGVNSSSFRSRRLTPELLDSCDWIIPMTEEHRKTILHFFPEAEKKTHLLMEFAGSGCDVPDPFGGSEKEYLKVFDFMRPALDQMAEKIARYSFDKLP